MGGNKDLIIHQEYSGDQKPPLVSPLSRFDEMMYDEIVRLNKRVKAITKILEGCYEK